MKIKPRVLMSLLLAVVAVILVAVYLNTREAALLELATPRDAVVATDDILANTPIDESQVKLAKIPQKYLQPGPLSDLRLVIGQVSTVPVLKGSQISGTQLSSYGRGTGLAFKVPRGKRAVTVAVNDINGVATLVQPGNYVDIVALVKFGSFPANAMANPMSIAANQQSQAMTLFQNVLVLATGRDTGEAFNLSGQERTQAKQRLEQYGQTGNPGKADTTGVAYTSVTFAMTPENAQDLILAQNIGDLTLVLRSYLEKDTVVELKNSTAITVLKVDMPVVPRHAAAWREIRGQ
ncbi:MAG: Flp pilus assembly protein CpaB [Acidobacteriia bacterium]|nr:Flp pilus assembly protein CpaB [Terriglobia bacterium]